MTAVMLAAYPDLIAAGAVVAGLPYGPDALGVVAPYRLEAGISSTLEIARFWSLAGPAAASRPAHTE